ncbi:hypothetical protein PVAP13_4KG311800 [Panicum virgatum]|uniref:Uncharacterized protein n=1 Tax=Panicum virgatum TaxID=38727 RepID=A0A8T0TLP3_PANVG|nr:hypothetical protein PVAP13_4KG311800 [Panicum virgatum]
MAFDSFRTARRCVTTFLPESSTTDKDLRSRPAARGGSEQQRGDAAHTCGHAMDHEAVIMLKGARVFLPRPRGQDVHPRRGDVRRVDVGAARGRTWMRHPWPRRRPADDRAVGCHRRHACCFM